MQGHLFSFSSLLAILAFALAALAQTTGGLKILDDSDKYEYYGCYNETTNIEGSAQTRALSDGINQVKQGEMTVPMCLAYCSGGRTEYRYAGLEYARECWCGQVLAGIAAKLDDKECNLPCDGDNSTACGGPLKLTVYKLSSAGSGISRSVVWTACGILLAMFLQSV